MAIIRIHINDIVELRFLVTQIIKKRSKFSTLQMWIFLQTFLFWIEITHVIQQ